MATEMTDAAAHVGTSDLCLGATNPRKVIHHRRCASARRDYGWARQFDTLTQVARELVITGAWRWHRCCQRCCGDLDDEVLRALRDMGIFNEHESRWN